MWNRSLSVRQALLGLILTVGVPLILLAIVLMRQSLNNERSAIRDSHLAAARSLAALVEKEVEIHTTLAAALASSRALAAADLADFHAQATRVASETKKTWIALSDRQGRPLLSTLRPFGDELPLRTNSKYAVDAAVASRSPFLSDIVPGEVSGLHIALLEYPVIQAGEVVYSISVTLQPEAFRSLIAEKFGPNAAVAVIDRQRRFVARIPDHDSRIGTPAAASWIAAIEASSEEGFTESVTLEGVPSLTSYAATRHGWIAGISYPLETLYAPVNRQLWVMTTLGGVFVMLVLALAFGLSRRLEKPLRILDADRLSRGEPVQPMRLGIREADDISSSLSASSEILRHRMNELEEARKHQMFLLRELAHRLKNQLTVINSMIRQTARGRSNTTEFATVLGERLQGLAVGVDLLLNQHWRAAPLRELVDGQIAPFLPSQRRILIEGPDVMLPPELTQALGLAFHELATNAVKYGAWSAEGGIVEVTWTLKNGDAGQALKLTWRESGGPTVTPPTRRGFGQVVIDQAAGRGDGSSMGIRFEPSGVVWTMTATL